MKPKSLALQEARKSTEDALLALADVADERSLTDEETAKVAELTASLADVRKREELARTADAVRALRATDQPEGSTVTVGDEDEAALRGGRKVEARDRDVYGADAKREFFQDLITASNPHKSQDERSAASDALRQHYAANGDENHAKRAVELRTYSVGTPGEGGYLVAPAYLQNEFVRLIAETNTASRLVTTVPIDSGDLGKTVSVNIPRELSRAGVGAHTENNALTASDATFGTVAVDIKRRGGRATVPNFLLDRSLPGVGEIIMSGLADAAAEDLNDLIMLVNNTNGKGFLVETGLGDCTYTAATPELDGFKQAALNGIEDVYTAMRRSAGMGILMAVRRWFWILNLVDQDSNGYLRINDKAAFDMNGVPTDATVPVGYLAGVPIYIDHSIPLDRGSGTDQDAVIVGRFAESWLLRSAPKFAVSEHAGFDNDQTKMRVVYDAGFSCARRKDALSVMEGTGLAI